MLCIGSALFAQPTHVGLLVSDAGSDGKDGNGSLVGVAIQGVANAKVVPGLSVVSSLKFSKDFKGYLNERGNAVRSEALLRYAIPNGQGFFVEAGGSFSHISFADTSATVKNGYQKRIATGVVGIGNVFEFPYKSATPRAWITARYDYFLPSHLTATDTHGNNPVRDGSSVTHKFAINGIYEIKNGWLALANVTASRNAYQRDCGLYGAALCGEVHRSLGWELQFGVGKRF